MKASWQNILMDVLSLEHFVLRYIVLRQSGWDGQSVQSAGKLTDILSWCFFLANQECSRVPIWNPKCQLLATCGNFYQLVQLLVTCGNLWQLVTTFGNLCQLLVTCGKFWQFVSTKSTFFEPGCFVCPTPSLSGRFVLVRFVSGLFVLRTNVHQDVLSACHPWKQSTDTFHNLQSSSVRIHLSIASALMELISLSQGIRFVFWILSLKTRKRTLSGSWTFRAMLVMANM